MKPFSLLVASVILASVIGCAGGARAARSRDTDGTERASAHDADGPARPRHRRRRTSCAALPFGKGNDRPAIPIPADAVRVFTFEAGPCRPALAGENIAVDYGAGGVLF